MDAVVLDDVVMRYGKGSPALDGVSARLPRGEDHRPRRSRRGAGKSTLMRLIAGLIGARQGTVTVLGRLVPEEAEAVRARLGYMPQGGGLYTDLTVAENLTLFADLKALRQASGRPGSTGCSASTGWRRSPDRPAASFRAAWPRSWASPAPWCARPNCCCSTNHRSASIRSAGGNCGGWCGTSPASGLAVVWSTAYLDEGRALRRRADARPWPAAGQRPAGRTPQNLWKAGAGASRSARRPGAGPRPPPTGPKA